MKKKNISKEEIEELYNIFLETKDLTGFLKTTKKQYTYKSATSVFKQFYKHNLIYCANQVDIDNIDSEEKAYFLGLLYADGSLIRHQKNSNNFKVVISLQEKDGYILKHIASKLFPFANVTLQIRKKDKWSNVYCLTLSGKDFIEKLVSMGLKQNKTEREYEIPKSIPKHLIHHFIRGYFDGDGCISIHRSNHRNYTRKGNLYNRVSIPCLTKLILYNIQQETNLGNIRLVNKGENRKKIYYYTIENKNGVKLFYNYIYKDSTIFLSRKKEKFLHDNPVLTYMLTSISSVETTD